MENQRKLWFDQNDQPPKNYIWYKNGQFLEYIDGRWVPSDGLSSGSGGGSENSVKRYTVNDLSEIENPKNGDIASIPDKEWVYDGDFSSVSIPTDCIATLDLKKPLPEDVLSVFLMTGQWTMHTLGETEFPIVVSAVMFMPAWNSESGPASDYLSLTGTIKGKNYEYSNGQWNEVKGTSQQFIVIDEPFTMNSLVKVNDGQEGDIYEFAEQTWKLENTDSVIKFPPYFMASVRNLNILLKDNADTSMEEETESNTLNIYLDNELIWSLKHNGYSFSFNNIYDNERGYINLSPWETNHDVHDMPLTNLIPSVLEKLGQRTMSNNQITVTEDNDGNWSLFDVWDFELYSKPVYYEKKNGTFISRGSEVLSGIQGLFLNILDTYDAPTISMSTTGLFIVKNDGIYYQRQKIGSLAAPQPISLTSLPDTSITTIETLAAIGITTDDIRRAADGFCTGIKYSNTDPYTSLNYTEFIPIKSAYYDSGNNYRLKFDYGNNTYTCNIDGTNSIVNVTTN